MPTSTLPKNTSSIVTSNPRTSWSRARLTGPYFVMELVRGVPLTTYCDTHQLPPRERLELFIQVCHADQHAPQKYIIHRDLKPPNILVTGQADGPLFCDGVGSRRAAHDLLRHPSTSPTRTARALHPGLPCRPARSPKIHHPS